MSFYIKTVSMFVDDDGVHITSVMNDHIFAVQYVSNEWIVPVLVGSKFFIYPNVQAAHAALKGVKHLAQLTDWDGTRILALWWIEAKNVQRPKISPPICPAYYQISEFWDKYYTSGAVFPSMYYGKSQRDTLFADAVKLVSPVALSEFQHYIEQDV